MFRYRISFAVLFCNFILLVDIQASVFIKSHHSRMPLVRIALNLLLFPRLLSVPDRDVLHFQRGFAIWILLHNHAMMKKTASDWLRSHKQISLPHFFWHNSTPGKAVPSFWRDTRIQRENLYRAGGYYQLQV